MKKNGIYNKRKTAGILLITAILLSSTSIVMANTVETETNLRFCATTPSSQLPLLGETELCYYTGEQPQFVWGSTGTNTWEAAIRLTSTELAGHNGDILKAVRWFFGIGEEETAVDHDGKIKIYDQGSETSPGALLTEEAFTATAEQLGWVRIELSSPVTIDASKDIWVSVETTFDGATHYFGVGSAPGIDKKTMWFYEDGSWAQLTDIDTTYSFDWFIGAIVDQGSSGTELEISSISVDGFKILNATIKNKGQADAVNVVMSMKVTGGIFKLINETFPGSVASLAAGANVSLLSEKMFGLGKIAIVVTAIADNAPAVSKEASGLIVGPFIFGVK